MLCRSWGYFFTSGVRLLKACVRVPLFRFWFLNWVRFLGFQKGSFKDLGFEVRGSKTGYKGRVFAIPGRGLPLLRFWELNSV